MYPKERYAQLLSAVDSGIISIEECNGLLDADLVARGRQDGEERYLLVEVSSVADVNDRVRAVRIFSNELGNGRWRPPLRGRKYSRKHASTHFYKERNGFREAPNRADCAEGWLP